MTRNMTEPYQTKCIRTITEFENWLDFSRYKKPIINYYLGICGVHLGHYNNLDVEKLTLLFLSIIVPSLSIAEKHNNDKMIKKHCSFSFNLVFLFPRNILYIPANKPPSV